MRTDEERVDASREDDYINRFLTSFALSWEAMKRVLLSCVGILPLLASGCESTIIGEGSLDSDNSDESAEIRIGNFPGPDGPIRAPYVLEGDMAVVGGDILWPISSSLSINAATGPFTRWPGGIIPYENSENNTAFLQGVNAWNAVSNQTGITLVERTNQPDYVNVVSATHRCASELGMSGGKQNLLLNVGGCPKSSAIHEIGHAIGLVHEHTRPDRDNYIRFNWDNLVGGRQSEFAQTNLGIAQGATSYGAYDIKSIMHYRNTGYGPTRLINTRLPLFKVVGSGSTVIKNTKLSQSDINGVAAMYEGYGGQTPDEEPDNSCLNTCERFGMDEDECKKLGSGNYVCEDSCLKRVNSCTNAPPPDTFTCTNGQQIEDRFYCDDHVDCNDSSDESACGNGTEPEYGTCTVGSQSGGCIDTGTTTCFGQLHTGYCSGGNEIRCCTN